jgi:hypothetical protein
MSKGGEKPILFLYVNIVIICVASRAASQYIFLKNEPRTETLQRKSADVVFN